MGIWCPEKGDCTQNLFAVVQYHYTKLTILLFSIKYYINKGCSYHKMASINHDCYKIHVTESVRWRSPETKQYDNCSTEFNLNAFVLKLF